MKKILVCLAVLVASLPVLRADDAAPAACSGGSSTQQDRMEKFMAMMQQLNLTEDQKAKIKQIRASTQAGPERREQIAAVLTAEQKEKLRELIKQHREQ